MICEPNPVTIPVVDAPVVDRDSDWRGTARGEANMNIFVDEQILLTEFRASDKVALVQHLNDRNIYERTLRIPYPYTAADADAWLAIANKPDPNSSGLHPW